MSYHSGQPEDPCGSIRLPLDIPWLWQTLEQWSASIMQSPASGDRPENSYLIDPSVFITENSILVEPSTVTLISRRVWQSSGIEDIDNSLVKLWQAGLFLATAIERSAQEIGFKLPFRGMAWSILLQGPLWAIAAKSSSAFHQWLNATSSADSKFIENQLLGTTASLWSQIFLQGQGLDEVARLLWITRDLKNSPQPGNQGQGNAANQQLVEVLSNAIKLYQQSRYYLGKTARQAPSVKDPKVTLIELQVDKIARREAMFAPANDHYVRLVIHTIDQHQKQRAQERWQAKATSLLNEIERSARKVMPGRITQAQPIQVLKKQASQAENDLEWLDSVQQSWQSLQSFWWKTLERMDEWADDVSHDHHVSESQAHAMRFESLAEFAAGAGHELNNPLAVIQGRAQQLLAKTQDASNRQALKAIVDQTLRAHRMLRDLIFIARPGRANLAPFRPAEITRSVVRELREEADRRRVTIELNPQLSSKLMKMETDQLDPDGFRQILLGLGRNAIEASPHDGLVHLHLSMEFNNSLKIQVVDQGHGFSSTDAAHLFDPFYCGRKAGRGLGLGLPRLARVVAQMNGRIRYRSNPGSEGSTFEVILPLAEHPRQSSLSHSA